MTKPQKNMDATLKNFSESISILLRYIASGFIGLLLYMFLNNIKDVIISKDSLFLVLLAATVGLITYSFHIAWLDKVIYKWHAFKIFKDGGHNVEKLQQAIKDCEKKLSIENNSETFDKEKVTKEGLKFALLTQTYLRNISKDEQIQKLQNLLEQRLALLSFLYCAIYQIIGVLTYYILTKRIVYQNNYSPHEYLNLGVTILILILLAIAVFKFDRRICKRELWAIAEFYQCPKPQ